MKEKISILFAILTLFLFSNLVLATGSISITSVSIPTSATQGDTFTITMSVSGSSVQNNQASGSLTLPSGLSCTPSGTQTISLGTGGTGSTSWSCSASVAGDYSSRITASVTATDSATASGLSDTAQTGLTILSPASITVSSTLSSSSISTGSSTTFTVGVNNAGGSSTTFNISLTCPTGLTCSPSSVGNTAISATSLSNNQFTVTGSSAGSYTLTATVNSPSQSGLTTSKTLTVSTDTGTTTAAAAGGGGGALPVTTTGKLTKTFAVVFKNVTNTILSSELNQSGTNFTQINFTVLNVLSNVQMIISGLSGNPVASSPLGVVYQFMNISKTNLDDVNISSATIQFKVAKSWISSNNIDSSTVALYRYLNGWSALTTAKISEDANYIYYQASSPGFSYFAVSGRAKTTTTTAAPTATTSPIATGTASISIPPIAGSQTNTYLIVGIVLLIVFVVALVWFRRKK